MCPTGMCMYRLLQHWGWVGLLAGIGLALMWGLILLLRQVKGYQHIYAFSPGSHQAKKFTVSFGGVGILGIVLIAQLIHPILDPKGVWVLGVLFSFGVVGFLDDFISATQKMNKGLSATQKFGIQVALAVGFMGLWQGLIAPLSWGMWLLDVVVIVGASNATNLTDGLDGLLGGLSLITLAGFGWHFYHLASPDLFWICVQWAVAVACFLVFNRHPAKIFMGDTGSLALGAGFAALAIAGGNPWILLSLGAVYGLETASVMIQVAAFKFRKKRVFLMSPLHHHFELLGFSEWQIVSLFWGMGLAFLGYFMVTQGGVL